MIRIAARVRGYFAWRGFAVGFVIGALALWCTGFGHGTYLPVALSSAPLSGLGLLLQLGKVLLGLPDWSPESSAVLLVLGIIAMIAMLCGSPFVWAVMTGLARAPRTERRTRLFVGTVLSHYLVGVIAIGSMIWEDWRYLNDTWRAVPEVVVGWALVYAGAHVLLWRSFLRNQAKQTPAPATAG
jgi:hypothetical protein